jgi:long-chain acyl-CoA synthetase
MMQPDPRFPHLPTLVHILRASIAAEPERVAMICGERQVSYTEFGRAVAGLATRLAPLRVAGGRIVVMVPNSIETAVAILATVTARAQVVPVNPFYTMSELGPLFGIAEAAAVICDATTVEKAEGLARLYGIPHVVQLGLPGLQLDDWIRDPACTLESFPLPDANDPALLIFTGGTTGVPKGVNHSHRALTFSHVQHCSMWPVEFGRERFLTVTPMFHIWGLGYALLVPIYTRGTLVIIPRYDADTVVQALSDHRITVFGGGPAPIYLGLLHSPKFASADLSQLKYSLSGGSPCPEELHHNWLQCTGCALFEGFGMSEGAPLSLNPAWGTRKIRSVGVPVALTEIRIVDLETGSQIQPVHARGEICVRGPQVTSGYRNNPAETAQALRDGWLHTGDIGYLDDDGYLFIVDRKKEMVIVGGYNVYPREIDELLFAHPAIKEAAAVGQSDEILGETLAAYVVLQPGATLTEEEFFDFCKDRLVKYKRPVAVHFITELPRTGVGKINKMALRRR